jgi:hypothetical protein
MRKQSEINRAIEHLKACNDNVSRIQLEVLETKRSESWVFNRYVRDVPEDERNEKFDAYVANAKNKKCDYTELAFFIFLQQNMQKAVWFQILNLCKSKTNYV